MRNRHEIWGDNPEERDADTTVAELAGLDVDRTHRRSGHPFLVPIRVVARFIAHSGKRIAVTIAGVAVIVAGVAMLVLPGPGWAAIFLGLWILSTQYVWAERLLKKAKSKAEQAKEAVRRKRFRGSETPAGKPEPRADTDPPV